jgi:two-component system, chemotaxis family, protein-glutamate methylesterase/glutaminase
MVSAAGEPGSTAHRERPDGCVFIGGSAGAIEALAELLSRLPRDFGASVLVTLHVGMTGASVLPSILDRVGSLHAVSPADGESLVRGVVYVAPRGRHLVVQEGRIRLGEGPTEHGVRPAIDPMFRSAAREFGPRAIGVVLSGMLDDGTAGLGEIRAQGGWALVQQPSEASFPNMPQSAIGNVDVDEVLPIAELAERIDQLVRSPRWRPNPTETPPVAAASSRVGELDGAEPAGMRTEITCPECGGVLWEDIKQRLTIYRCQAGHAFSADSLLVVQGDGLDTAIWRPIRMLRERGALLRRLAQRASGQGRERSARYFEEQADDALRRAAEMRRAMDASSRARPSASEAADFAAEVEGSAGESADSGTGHVSVDLP